MSYKEQIMFERLVCHMCHYGENIKKVLMKEGFSLVEIAMHACGVSDKGKVTLEEAEKIIRIIHKEYPQAVIDEMEMEMCEYGSLKETELLQKIYDNSGYTNYSYTALDCDDNPAIFYRIVPKQ